MSVTITLQVFQLLPLLYVAWTLRDVPKIMRDHGERIARLEGRTE